MNDVTQLLHAIDQGDPHAAGQLLPLVYDELRRLAAHKLAHEAPGQTLEPTALVHEAYLRLVGGDALAQFDGRGHFFAAAAEAMRRILVEAARRKGRHRHGGGRQRVGLADTEPTAGPPPDDDLLALDDALRQLETAQPEVAAVVKLRYFAGLTAEEAASALGVSLRTANRHWAFARAWLLDTLGGEGATA